MDAIFWFSGTGNSLYAAKRRSAGLGDHLENTESRQKVEIGTAWQNMAGKDYRYYMVFKEKDLNVKGAVRFDRFMEIVRGL